MSNKKKAIKPTYQHLEREVARLSEELNSCGEKSRSKNYEIEAVKKELQEGVMERENARMETAGVRSLICEYALAVANPVTAKDQERIRALQERIVGRNPRDYSPMNVFRP
jgi:chromosome segregation ATPase